MIGWFLAGVCIGAGKVHQDARREQRRAERARKRREEPLTPAVWVAYGVLFVAALFHPAALAGVVIAGAFLWSYTVRRGRERAAWLAEQAEAKAERDRAWLADREAGLEHECDGGLHPYDCGPA